MASVSAGIVPPGFIIARNFEYDSGIAMPLRPVPDKPAGSVLSLAPIPKTLSWKLLLIPFSALLANPVKLLLHLRKVGPSPPCQRTVPDGGQAGGRRCFL
ncbi:MAG: hypothetical protein JWM59_5041 [Verrucomicrobiales bacterium]|nr:hypothetical protein [Verrucomicrobiales bacterium]